MSEFNLYIISTGISVLVSSFVFILNNNFLYRFLNGRSNQLTDYNVQTDDSLQPDTARKIPLIERTKGKQIQKLNVNTQKIIIIQGLISAVINYLKIKKQSLEKLITASPPAKMLESHKETIEQLNKTISILANNDFYPFHYYRIIFIFLHEQLRYEKALLPIQIAEKEKELEEFETALAHNNYDYRICPRSKRKQLIGNIINLQEQSNKVKRNLGTFNKIAQNTVGLGVYTIKQKPFKYILYELEREEQILFDKIQKLERKIQKENNFVNRQDDLELKSLREEHYQNIQNYCQVCSNIQTIKDDLDILSEINQKEQYLEPNQQLLVVQEPNLKSNMVQYDTISDDPLVGGKKH